MRDPAAFFPVFHVPDEKEPTMTHDPSRAALVPVASDIVLSLFPKGTRIQGVEYDASIRSWLFVVSHPDLNEVPEGQRLPQATVMRTEPSWALP